MKPKLKLFILTAGLLSLFGVPSQAQEIEIGKRDFRLRCAACHGPAGLGDGMIGGMLKVPPSDLTRIAERNGGVFPFKKIYDIIDGRSGIAAHGSREMPVWGDYYHDYQMPVGELPPDATERQADAPERAVERYVLALVYYIGTLQAQK